MMNDQTRKPTWERPCARCGVTIRRWRGQGDVQCSCGASYNVSGQRLADGWASNPSWRDDEIDDLTGYELSQQDY